MDQEKKLSYNIFTKVFAEGTNMEVERECNSITIINRGSVGSVVVANGIILNQNDSFTFGGNRLEIFVGRFVIEFQGGGTQLAIVVQKCYIPNC